MARLHGADRECGVYAVLYAALVVVLIGMGAIVVDLASLREDRRTDRSAADSAVVAAGQMLDPFGPGGVSPRKACDAAWSYLVNNVQGITKPAGACTTAPNNFPLTAPASCPTAQIGGPVNAGNGYFVTIAWPVPQDSGFLQPDLAPGSTGPLYASATPYFDAAVDGPEDGCQRVGVALEHERDLGLAAGLGGTRGRTISHSVALVHPGGGPSEDVAALNVLNRTDCQALVTLGGGKVLVGPTVDGASVVGPGIISVESDGNGGCSGPNDRVIAPNTSSGGSLICASSVQLNSTGSNCDGLGAIRSHALDPGGQRSYDTAAIPTNLKPVPTPAGGRFGWNPVTKLYGCVNLTPCADPMPPVNYINELKNKLGGSGLPPSNYASSAMPYSPAVTGPFTAVPPAVCANITTPITLPPGNWYANCQINVNNGGQLIVEGGTLVVQDGIDIATGACFVMNGITCTPTVVGAGTSEVTTATPPSTDAIIYLRSSGCPNSGCFNTAGKTIMEKTFVFSTDQQITVNSVDLTLWTAPGAGAENASGRTSLEVKCFVTATNTISQTCLNSRFSRLTYWSEFAALKTKANDFAGQGSLSVVGVFFIPQSYFDVSGGSAYTAAAAQFWADKIRVNGTAFLGLRPDVRTSIPIPTSAVSLIR